MASLNRVELLGSVADKSQMRYTPSGKGVLFFTLEIEGFPNVFPICVWGQLAKRCDEQLRKGGRIFLEGRLVIDNKTVIKTTSIFDGEEFEDEEDKYSVQIIAKKVEFLDNQPLDNSVSGNKDKIEDVIQCLEAMALDPMVDHKMIRNLIDDLNSLDVENMD